MLTINKTCVILPANNMQNNQRYNSHKMQALTKDTVSFKAREQSFLNSLRELYKKPGDRNLLDTVEVLAADVDPKHPDVMAEFNRIKDDKTITEGIKAWILEDLPQCIGIGGNKVVNPKWGKDFTK
jgi:hypothetical protein